MDIHIIKEFIDKLEKEYNATTIEDIRFDNHYNTEYITVKYKNKYGFAYIETKEINIIE